MFLLMFFFQVMIFFEIIVRVCERHASLAHFRFSGFVFIAYLIHIRFVIKDL